MNTHDLETFLDVARHGSFAAVARLRNVDPSSISRQIAALETALGYRLFDRTTRRLAMTEAGRITFDRIQNPLEEIAQVRAAAGDAVGNPTGLIRVTASVAFGERWLVPRLAAFRKSYPDIDLDLSLTDRQLDLVADNIDVAIRLGNRVEGGFIVSRLMPTRYHVVASPKYIAANPRCAAPEDLAHHDTVVFPLPGYRSSWRFRKPPDATREIAINGTLTISNALAVRRAALEGLGVALLSDWTVGDDLEAGTLVDLFPDYEASASDFDTAAWILYPSRAYVPAKTRVFIDYLRSAL
ncbi:LysR family transcriptional regulator [Hoeflea sp.]|uniref:LysR family transcriptional regulator n=1 Tax=Hoeflea sp. TaxID=1940281 RepID=UPI003B01917D